MTPYDQLMQAVRDGDTPTAIFLLAWLEGGLAAQDRAHSTDHMGTVQKELGKALRNLGGAW